MIGLRICLLLLILPMCSLVGCRAEDEPLGQHSVDLAADLLDAAEVASSKMETAANELYVHMEGKNHARARWVSRQLLDDVRSSRGSVEVHRSHLSSVSSMRQIAALHSVFEMGVSYYGSEHSDRPPLSDVELSDEESALYEAYCKAREVFGKQMHEVAVLLQHMSVVGLQDDVVPPRPRHAK